VKKPEGRWRAYTYDDLIAQVIADDLRSVLEQMENLLEEIQQRNAAMYKERCYQ